MEVVLGYADGWGVIPLMPLIGIQGGMVFNGDELGSLLPAIRQVDQGYRGRSSCHPL
jgi:hypothetical protein